MNTDELKNLAAPKLAKAKEEQNNKIDAVIRLLITGNELKEAQIVLSGALCDSADEVKKINAAILEEKKSNHAEWIRSTNRRFYISLVAVWITGAVLWLDVLKLNEKSEVVGSAIGFIDALMGLF